VQTFLNDHIVHMKGICRIQSNFLLWLCSWRCQCHWIANR